jgi:hypothetical protein
MVVVSYILQCLYIRTLASILMHLLLVCFLAISFVSQILNGSVLKHTIS